MKSLAIAVLLCAFGAYAEQADPEQVKEPGAGKVELPGITIDVQRKQVDVDAKVVLEDGLLEVIACTADSREHESIFVVDAVPMHIHTALLLIGAENGHPAMVKPANEEKTEWLHLPPRGDPIGVSVIYPDPKNKDKRIERPVSDFIKRTQDDPAAEDDEDKDPPAKVFDTFVFAGSILRENEDGERSYIADINGNVISISTFGDEVLCMPAQISQDNAALVWSVNSKHLPAKGTKVKLRLTLEDLPEDQGGE